jgi:hypothetical protein
MASFRNDTDDAGDDIFVQVSWCFWGGFRGVAPDFARVRNYSAGGDPCTHLSGIAEQPNSKSPVQAGRSKPSMPRYNVIETSELQELECLYIRKRCRFWRKNHQ